MRIFIGLIAFISLQSYAKSFVSTSVPNEWILSRDAGSDSWKRVRTTLRGVFEFQEVFGPDDRFALVKLKANRAGVHIPRMTGIKAQPNYIYSSQDSMDPDFEQSWGLSNTGQAVGELGTGKVSADVGATKAWSVFKGSKQTLVAIIDSGVDRVHEDLQNNIWQNPNEIPGNGIDDDANGFVDDIHGWNFVAHSPDSSDDRGHGTFVAGIIGAAHGNGKGTRGVNSRVSLMPLKAMDSLGTGTTVSVIQALKYAVASGAKIVNMSWGGEVYDPALYDSIRWAGFQGVLCVIAAGNAYKNNDIDPRPYYPASFRLANILSVAAYDNQDHLAEFSDFGKETVHIGAPGVAVFSTRPGGVYALGSGTSFATPHVAGVAALVWGFIPSLSMGAIRERLLATSEVMGYYEKNRVASAGRINAWNALRDIRPPRPVTPTKWTRKAVNIGTSHPYANYAADTYRVEMPGAAKIRVHFSNFATEECCDSLVIRDNQGTEIWKYSGNMGPTTSVEALGDKMDLYFTSDFSTGDFGFEVDAIEANYDF